jgi:acyl dehydratase
MDLPYKRTLDDFQVGQIFKHLSEKIISEEDHRQFCDLTMNLHPIHLDRDYASKSQHGQILIVGTYIISLAVGMSVPDISGAAIAALEYQNVVHHNPVFIGDTVRAETEIINITLSTSKPDRGVVEVETKAYNQYSKLVLSFNRKVLVPKSLPSHNE